MMHFDFSDFSLVEQLATPELSGAPSFVVKEAIAAVFSEFCEKTRCFMESVTQTIDTDQRDVHLTSPHDGSRIIGVQALSISGQELKPGDYSCNSSSLLRLSGGYPGEATILVVLKPLATTPVGPVSIIERWADDISCGVKARLMAMPEKPWSNPELSVYYRSRYESRLLDIATDVKNEYSVSRPGRAPFTHSVFGV